MKDVFIGIGSNVDREANITSCINELRNVFSNLEISPVYETSSMGFEGPNFFNLVCKFSTDEELLNLKKMLNKIEIEHGRTFGEEKFSSRTLDIDILYYGDLIIESDEIKLPRDEITRYDFVLKPLVDIAPDFVHPVKQLTNKRILAEHEIEKLIIKKIELRLK